MKNLKLISKIGQGISGVGREENQNKKITKERIEAIRYGVKKGINFIDTALIYGNGFSEKILEYFLQNFERLCCKHEFHLTQLDHRISFSLMKLYRGY